ncbi:MAG: Gfo/Idh/MocA family oxidoreductase [Cyclobacteriaceae bacterium]|nr:Gfo/Idh/MocA family oxidoreductase [Cyclobacteriaceae bacterium HetDA_MAG_MS6]
MKKYTRRDALKGLIAANTMALPLSSWATTVSGHKLILPNPAKPPSRSVTAITLGAGNRGNVYGNYALEYPDHLDIVGVAEPIDIRRSRYADKHNIKKKNALVTWEHVFDRPKFADAVIISTPDDLHYGPCMKALEMGYDILLEKPIAPTEQECRDILVSAKKNGNIVAVCHVLRYAPYFQQLQKIVSEGLLGEVVSIQHFEPIQHVHMSHSYVRGNWHNSEKTTPIILAKSCHDLDIIKWMLGKKSKKIQAFGSLSWFKSDNAPQGSTSRCTDGCAIEDTCPYSALKIYHLDRTWLHHFDLPEDPSAQGEAIMTYLKESDYGRCVYRMDNDQPDHYTSNILFEDDVTAAFSMEAFTSYHGRRTRIMGSMGDIVGDMSKYTWTDFRTGASETWEQQTDGHGGGDWRIVADWVQAVSQKDPTLLTSTIDASIESHIMGFMAENSRKQGQVVDINLS